MREGVAEALKRISELPTKDEKIFALRTDHNKTMEFVVNLCYHPKVKFLVPEGEVPFRAQPKATDLQNVLFSEQRRLKVFFNSGVYPNLKQIRREQLFVEFLESIDQDDAELICSIREKKLPYKGLNKKIFEEAWPTLASGWKVKVEAGG